LIVLDTSVVVGTFSGPKLSAPAVFRALQRGERLAVPAVVFYEWLRGPRKAQELADQEALLPAEQALPFGPAEAARAAAVYTAVRRSRHREMDLAIAASALVHNAELWTLNLDDFRDIPGLRVSRPA